MCKFKETLENCDEIYISIKATAIAREMKNTIIALSVANQLHRGQLRKSGEPYIIHPLLVCKSLVNLDINDDVTYAAALLHDVKEDCKLSKEQTYEMLCEKYGLDKEIADLVILLSKDPDYKMKDPEEKNYYEKIKKVPKATIIKIADRAHNLSTADAFNKEKMLKYVKETNLTYELCKYGKAYYPQYSNAITIFKYQIQSICETIEALYDVTPILVDPLKYRKTFVFVRDYSIGKNLKNTQKAIFVANKLHKGDVRRTGDPFILHPLRVCSYLIALRVNNDIVCSAALLHEVLKRCDLPKKGNELVEDYELDPEILETIKILTKPESMSKDEYYKRLMTNKYAIMVKLSNRAHTCTRLAAYSDEEKKEYILETKKYITKLCTEAQEEHPEYWEQIEIMSYHIFSICKIVETIMKDKESGSI